MDLVVTATQKLKSTMERRLLVSTATLDDKGALDMLKKRLLKSLGDRDHPWSSYSPS